MYGPCKKKATNVIAEIQSAYIAIHVAQQLGVSKLRINTDSTAVMNAKSQIAHWMSSEWKGHEGKDVVDRVYYEKLWAALRSNPQMEIQFNRVEAHKGNPHNEAADRLAKKGAELHCNYAQLQSKLLLVNYNLPRLIDGLSRLNF